MRSAMAMMAPLAWLSYDGPDAAVFFLAGCGGGWWRGRGCGGEEVRWDMVYVWTLKMQRVKAARQCSPRRPPPLVPGRSMSSENKRARQRRDRGQWGIGRRSGEGLAIKAGGCVWQASCIVNCALPSKGSRGVGGRGIATFR